MNDTLLQVAALVPALIIAIVFHEVAHGWVARALGDPTAAERKRLSLNPLRHVDPIGTVVLPGFLAMVKAPVIGWAKPVPVNKYRLNNPRYGMMAVAAAGPATNLVLAGVGAVLLGLVLRPFAGVPAAEGGTGFAMLALFYFIQINIFLALFNLLPLPPFDGSHIVEGLLPPDAARQYEKLRPWGFPLLIILLIALPSVIPAFDPVGWLVEPPVRWMYGHYMSLTNLIAQG